MLMASCSLASAAIRHTERNFRTIRKLAMCAGGLGLDSQLRGLIDKFSGLSQPVQLGVEILHYSKL